MSSERGSIHLIAWHVKCELEKIDKGLSDCPSFTVPVPDGVSDASKISIAIWLMELFPKCVKCLCKRSQGFVRMKPSFPIAANVYYIHLQGYDKCGRTPR